MPAPAPIKLYDRATGKEEAFASPEEATAAYAAGKAAPKLTDQVPVALADGQIGTVAGSDLASTLAAGGRLAAPGELRHAELAAKYGDGGSTIGAALAGAARGATLGLSDVALTGLAGGFGGDQGAANMRERLEAYRELHPVASTGGELAGIGATMLLPGLGAANAARGAVEGGMLARGLAGAAEVGGAIPRAVSGLGAFAERGAASALAEGGVEGGGLAARVLGSAVPAAARGAAEGMIYGFGSEMSESALGDTELAAEKLLTGMGHGALFGALAGGTLGAVAPLVRAAGEKVAPLVVPHLEGLAEEQAARALNARKAFVSEMERIPGGVRAVGRELLDSGLLRAGDSLEQIAPRVEKARAEAGAEIGRLLEAADARGFEGPTVASLVKRIRSEALPRLERMAETNKGAIGTIENVITDLENFASSKAGELPPLPPKPQLSDFDPKVVPKSARDALLAKTEAQIIGDSGGKAAYEAALRDYEIAIAQREAASRMTFQDLQGWRAQLDDSIRWNTNPVGPVNEKVEALKRVRAAIENEMVDAGEKAASARGGSFADEYQAAKLRYRRLAVADRAASDALERAQANQAHSLTDKIFGATGFATGLATHGPLGALAGPVTAFTSKAIRERGNATAAVLFDKFSVFRAVQAQTAKVDEALDAGVAKFFGRRARMPKLLPETSRRESSAKEYERAVQEVAAAKGDPERARAEVEAATEPLAAHAPKLHRALVDKSISAIDYLAAHIPAGRVEGPSATPHLDQPHVSEMERQMFLDRWRTVNDPRTALEAFAHGTASREQIEALRVVRPKLYEQLVTQVKSELAGAKTPPNYQRVIQLSAVLGQALDASQTPAFVAAMQAPKSPTQPKPPAPSAAPLKSFENVQTTTQRIEAR